MKIVSTMPTLSIESASCSTSRFSVG